jgi:hypothetical protein
MANRSEQTILSDMRNVECALSPENLTCDGELSNAEVKQRAASLHRKWDALVKELGRKPTTQELYQ